MLNALLVGLFTILVASAQIIPPECKTAPKIDIEAVCCPTLPSLLSKGIVKECSSDGQTSCEAAKCVMAKTKLLHTNGTVIEATVKNITTHIPQPEWVKVIDALFTNCTVKIQAPYVMCKPETFAECLTTSLVLSCPPKLWTNTTECEDAKLYMMNC